MVEYRRGIASKRKNDRWHWHAECDSYPLHSFAIRHDRPLDGELCSECKTCSSAPPGAVR